MTDKKPPLLNNIDMAKIDEEIENDINKLKMDIVVLLRNVEKKWGYSFRLKGNLQRSWIDGERLINHCSIILNQEGENEERLLLNEKHQ